MPGSSSKLEAPCERGPVVLRIFGLLGDGRPAAAVKLDSAAASELRNACTYRRKCGAYSDAICGDMAILLGVPLFPDAWHGIVISLFKLCLSER